MLNPAGRTSSRGDTRSSPNGSGVVGKERLALEYGCPGPSQHQSKQSLFGYAWLFVNPLAQAGNTRLRVLDYL